MQTENDGRNDFDFLIGTWKMRHRRLKERLKGSREWEEFEGTAVGKKLLNGLGHCDEVIMNRETGSTNGFTLRLFDVKSREWSIYWAAGASGILDVPVVGTSSAALPGRRLPRIPVSGNRLSRSMEARSGKRTG